MKRTRLEQNIEAEHFLVLGNLKWHLTLMIKVCQIMFVFL